MCVCVCGRAKYYREIYAELHTEVVARYTRSQNLHKGVKDINHQLLAEKIKLERQAIAVLEEKKVIDSLRKEKDIGKLRCLDETDKLNNLNAEKQEKLQDRKMNVKHVERLKMENEKLAMPRIEAIQKAISTLQVHSTMLYIE